MVRSIVIPLISLSCFSIALIFNQKVSYPIIQISKQDEAFNFKSETLSILSVGFKRLISDIMWIQTLMDSDLEHYKKKDLNSWLYLRFSTIAYLDPKFYENYYYGGQYLMVVKDDSIGAEDLFLKGLKVFPTDVDLNWQMGFLYGIERKEPQSALPFFDAIKFNPKRPKFFDSLYTKFSANISGAKEAYEFAFEAWQKLPPGDGVRLRLEKQLYTLKALMDIECLNAGNVGCKTRDFYGAPYIKKEGQWTAPQKILDLKLKN